MGCGTSKKSKPSQNSLKIEDIYDRILNTEKEIDIQSINFNPEPSKYLIPLKETTSPSYIIDQSNGYPMVLNIQSKKIDTINIPLSPGSRCMLISLNKIFVSSLFKNFIIDFPSLKQTYLPNMIQQRENSSILYFNQKIVVIGGNTTEELKSCEWFDYEKWEEISSLNVKRSWHSAIVAQNTIFVFGGLKTNTIEKLNGKWEVLLIKLPWNINRIGLAPLPDKILVVGGEIIGQGYCLAAWEFDLKNCSLVPIRKSPVQGVFYSQGGFFNDTAILCVAGLQIVYYHQFNSWDIISQSS